MSGFYLRESRSLDCGKEFESMLFFFVGVVVCFVLFCFLIRLRLCPILPEEGPKFPESEASKADLPV